MVDILKLEGVEPIDCRNEDSFIVITVKVKSDHLYRCPECEGHLYKHGQRTNQFADIPIQQPTKIEVVRSRYRCSQCKIIITPQLAFLDEKRRTTNRFIQYIRQRYLEKTFTQLAEDTGLAVNTIKNITLDFVKELESDVKFHPSNFD